MRKYIVLSNVKLCCFTFYRLFMKFFQLTFHLFPQTTLPLIKIIGFDIGTLDSKWRRTYFEFLDPIKCVDRNRHKINNKSIRARCNSKLLTQEPVIKYLCSTNSCMTQPEFDCWSGSSLITARSSPPPHLLIYSQTENRCATLSNNNEGFGKASPGRPNKSGGMLT